MYLKTVELKNYREKTPIASASKNIKRKSITYVFLVIWNGKAEKSILETKSEIPTTLLVATVYDIEGRAHKYYTEQKL